MIPKEDIEAVKDKADIADVISRYGVELKASGSSLKGLCPFHDEKGPSFHVRPSSGSYRCFGCGESGDVFSFVQQKEGFSFIEAVRSLAETYSINLRETQSEDEDNGINKRRLLNVMAEAAAFFAKNYQKLPHEHPARLELRKRNLEEVAGRPEWLTEFGIGYAQEGWSHLLDHLTSKGFTQEEMLTVGLISKNDKGSVFDFYRGRLMWEIRDIQGRVIGFGARRLFDSDQGPKYLNSGESPIYRKSSVLYGLDLARKQAVKLKQIVVVEGYTDVMAMHAAGVTNVIASSGTAFGDGHAGTLRRLLGEDGQYIFSFDADAAGQKAARSVFSLSTPIHANAFVAKPGNGDPDDIRRDSGDEALQRLVAKDNLSPLTDFVLRAELAQHDVTGPEGRSNFLKAAAELLRDVSDYSLRQDYIRKVSFWSGATLDVVQQIMTSGATSARPQTSGNSALRQITTPKNSRKQQQSLLALTIQYPESVYEALKEEEMDAERFDEDIAPTVTEIWGLVSYLKGDIGDVKPDDFGNPELLLTLLHHPFATVERVEGKDRDEMIKRMASSLYRSLQTINRDSDMKDLRSRVAASYGDTSSGDETILADILEQQKALRRHNKRRQR